MNVDIKGVHIEIGDSDRQYIEKKLARIEFARDAIIDLLLTISQQTKSAFQLEATINFRWGHSIHVREDAYDLIKGIDKLFDRMELKINKEKERIKEHKGKDSVRTGEGLSGQEPG